MVTEDEDEEGKTTRHQSVSSKKSRRNTTRTQPTSPEDSQTTLIVAAQESVRALPVFRSLDNFDVGPYSRASTDVEDDTTDTVLEPTARKSFDFLFGSNTSYIGDHFAAYHLVPLHGGQSTASAFLSSPQQNNEADHHHNDADDDEKTEANENNVMPQPDARKDDTKEEATMNASTAEINAEDTSKQNANAKLTRVAATAAAAQQLLSTESRVRDERIWARRMRIEQTRTKNLATPSQLALHPSTTDGLQDNNTNNTIEQVHQQIYQSDAVVVLALEDGESTLQNIVNGARRRYAARRASMGDELERLQIVLEEEHELFIEKFAVIQQRWAEKDDKCGAGKCADSLYALLLDQRAAFQERYDLKQRMIQRIQDTLKAVDEHYQKTIKKHESDVTLAASKFVSALNSCLSHNLQETQSVQDALYDELDRLRKTCNDEHTAASYKADHYHTSLIGRRMQLRDEFVEELEALRSEEADKFYRLKQKLTSDVQVIEQQLMLMKAGFQMNSEKLEYNLHVLKRRYEENLIERSKQKRRITRLQDSLTKVREKARRHQKRATRDIEMYADDCSRLAQQVVELHTKQCHFQSTDIEQFRSVWIVEELVVRKLLFKIIQLDRIINQQILGRPQWAIPDLSFLEECGPIEDATTWKANSNNYNNKKRQRDDEEEDRLAPDYDFKKSNQALLRTLMAEKAMKSYLRKNNQSSNNLVDPLRNVPPTIVSRVVELLVCEAGYLLESDALHALESLNANCAARSEAENTSRNGGLRSLAKDVTVSSGENTNVDKSQEARLTVVAFDAVLRALGIGTKEELAALIRYFALRLNNSSAVIEKTKASGQTTFEKTSSFVETVLTAETNHRLVLSGGATIEQVYGRAKRRIVKSLPHVAHGSLPALLNDGTTTQQQQQQQHRQPKTKPSSDQRRDARIQQNVRRNTALSEAQLFEEFDENLERVLLPLDDVLCVLQKLVDDYPVAIASAVAEKKKRHASMQPATTQQRDSSKDEQYFRQYSNVYNLQEKLQVWSCLFKALGSHYRDTMHRIASSAQARHHVNVNVTALDTLASLMMSPQANALEMPPLVTILADFKKLRPLRRATPRVKFLGENDNINSKRQARGRPKDAVVS